MLLRGLLDFFRTLSYVLRPVAGGCTIVPKTKVAALQATMKQDKNESLPGKNTSRSASEHSTLRERLSKVLRPVLRSSNTGKLKLNLQTAIPFWIASLLTGVVAVGYARVFAWAEGLGMELTEERPWLLFVLTPLCFVLAWWLVKRFSPYARGSGIPQVMAAIELANPKDNQRAGKLLSVKVVIVKVLSSLLMILGGGAVGREGPTIQIAGSVFHNINRLVPESWPKVSRKNMIMTGAAAGLAAAFNTPLGGIVFAVEELAKTHISHFRTAIFTAVIIAGLTAQWLIGPYLYLGYPVVKGTSTYIVAGVLGVAIVAGVGGSLLGKMILALLAWKRRHLTKAWTELLFVVGCAFTIAAIAYWVDRAVLGSGSEEISRVLFSGEKTSGADFPALRILGPMLSFTTGAAGGVFAPSLASGAVIGSWVSGWFSLSGADTNLIILTGMVAFLTGVTRSPFTSAILVLEMTDRHSVIFYLMLAGMVASVVAQIVSRHAFYDRLKHQYLEELGREEAIGRGHTGTGKSAE